MLNVDLCVVLSMRKGLVSVTICARKRGFTSWTSKIHELIVWTTKNGLLTKTKWTKASEQQAAC